MNLLDEPAQGKTDRALILVAAASLLVRLLLLNWYTGEYTDGILQLGLFANANTYLPPLYTFLTEVPRSLGLNPILSGRLISALASVAVLFPLHRLTRRLYGIHAARYAIVFYTLMAVPNRWSLRVMTDPLFTLFFVLSVDSFTRALDRNFRGWSLPSLVLWSGLAALTRYQGFIFLPLILIALNSRRSPDSAQVERSHPKWTLPLSFAPWLALLAWVLTRGVTHATQFQERMGNSSLETLLRYGDMAETFVVYLPYAVSWPVFAGSVVGLVKSRPGDHPQRLLLLTLAYLFPVWLIAHAAFQSFQYRYFLPMMPFFALYAGHGFTLLEYRLWKKPAGPECPCGPGLLSVPRIPTYIAFVWALAFSVCILTLQRHAFGDLATVARSVRDLSTGPSGRVFTTETYGPAHRFEVGPKAAYYTGKPVEYLFENVSGKWQMRNDLHAGDLILLSNAYGDIAAIRNDLSRRYRLEVVQQSAMNLWPLLPDIMVNPPVTSQPTCMAYRYHRQTYISVLLSVN